MTNPTKGSGLRRRLLRPSAILMTLATAGWLVGLFASSAEAKDTGNLTSAHAIAKHILPIKGTGKPQGKPGGGGGGKPKSNGIDYHNGPVMTASTTNVYYIWYGDWSAQSKGQTILTDFAKTIGGSPWYNIETSYFDGSGAKIKNSVTYAGTVSMSSSVYGTNLSDANIQSIVGDAISGKSVTGGALGSDPNGVYFVLTSADVGESSGFLTKYCGWHTYGTIGGANIKYSFVGDASKQLSSCAAQTSSSPNGDPAADAMASVIAHELAEAASDPNLNAWYDKRGYENADKCAWKFGTTYTATNGSTANMTLGSRDYLIQQNWVNAGGGSCTLSY